MVTDGRTQHLVNARRPQTTHTQYMLEDYHMHVVGVDTQGLPPFLLLLLLLSLYLSSFPPQCAVTHVLGEVSVTHEQRNASATPFGLRTLSAPTLDVAIATVVC